MIDTIDATEIVDRAVWPPVGWRFDVRRQRFVLPGSVTDVDWGLGDMISRAMLELRTRRVG